MAGETEEAVDRALKLIRVKYQVLDAVLDFRTAKDNPILVHPEKSWRSLCPVGGGTTGRNLCASGEDGEGDVEEVLSRCEYVVDETYHTKANQQAMMETFRAFAALDPYGRLVVTASTQVPFHVRRILANALDIPKFKGAGDQAQDRRRLRRQADGGGGGVPGHRHLAHRAPVQDRLQPLRVPDRILPQT